MVGEADLEKPKCEKLSKHKEKARAACAPLRPNKTEESTNVETILNLWRQA